MGVMAMPRTDRVLLLDPIDPVGVARLSEAVEVVRSPERSSPRFLEEVARCHGLILRSRLPADFIGSARCLRAIAIHGSGSDWVDLDAARARGIAVSNVPGGNARSVAEYCLMALLMLARRMPAASAATSRGHWMDARALAAQAVELHGLTLGIVGLGSIGRLLARMAHGGLGMRVLGYSPSQRFAEDGSFVAATLERLFQESDAVVLACPLTPQTRHLVQQRTLAWMKPTAWLINASRGAVVDQQALVDALRTGVIAAAVLDVYEHDKVEAGDPLLSLDNVVLTPHFAGSTVQARQRMALAVAEDMLHMLAGRPPGHLATARP